MTGRDSQAALDKVLETAKIDWQLEAPIDNLRQLKEQLTSLQDPEFDDRIRDIEAALEKMNGRLAEITNGVDALPSKESRERRETDKATDFIFENGLYYGELNSSAGGNIEYGGDLHAHTVNQWDFGVAREYLQQNELEGITDFEDFNAKIDVLLRERYGTAPLEDLHSPEHKVYDDFMKKFNSTLGAENLTKKGPDAVVSR